MEELKKIIQEAVPEIMELKFGCEIVYPGYQKATICGQQLNTYRVYCEQRNYCAFKMISDKELDLSLVHQILGRPIRLADVLMAIPLMELQTLIPASEEMPTGCSRLEHIVHNLWRLNDDNLDKQSPECIKFLTELLTKQIYD